MIYFKEIFSFTEGKPLLFTQLFFWGFFGVVLFFYTFVYKKIALRNLYLLLVSFFFYYKTSGVFLILLVFTICSDYNWGKLIHNATRQRDKKIFMGISVTIYLLLLSYFKYAYFFTDSCNQLFHTDIEFLIIFRILPIRFLAHIFQ